MAAVMAVKMSFIRSFASFSARETDEGRSPCLGSRKVSITARITETNEGITVIMANIYKTVIRKDYEIPRNGMYCTHLAKAPFGVRIPVRLRILLEEVFQWRNPAEQVE